jgi:hypothetical protein
MPIIAVVIVVAIPVIQDGIIVEIVLITITSQTICTHSHDQDQDQDQSVNDQNHDHEQQLETNAPHKNPTIPIKTTTAAVRLGLTSRSSQR